MLKTRELVKKRLTMQERRSSSQEALSELKNQRKEIEREISLMLAGGQDPGELSRELESIKQEIRRIGDFLELISEEPLRNHIPEIMKEYRDRYEEAYEGMQASHKAIKKAVETYNAVIEKEREERTRIQSRITEDYTEVVGAIAGLAKPEEIQELKKYEGESLYQGYDLKRIINNKLI